MASNSVTSMALFCDFENIALGVRDAKYEKFDIGKILERLLLKGSIVVKKAYCDWERYKAFKAPMHEASFELIEIPHVRQSGKNSADIRMVVDALDLCYTKSHVETFVIISGDSDFSPLVSKLRENNKQVIGVGVKNSTSDLLIANCDEFIYYDDLVRESEKRKTTRRRPAAKTAAVESKVAAAEPKVAAGESRVAPDAKNVAAEAKGAKSATKRPAGRGARAAVAAPETAAETIIAAAEATDVALASEDAPVEAKAGRARGRGRGKRAAVLSEGAPVAEGHGSDTAVPVSEEPVPAVASAEPMAAAGSGEPGATEVQARDVAAPRKGEGERRQEGLDLIIETVEALVAERGEEEKIWGSMVKQALKRRKPGFSESYYGYRSFNGMLQDAQKDGLLFLESDEKSGGYVVRLAPEVGAA